MGDKRLNMSSHPAQVSEASGDQETALCLQFLIVV